MFSIGCVSWVFVIVFFHLATDWVCLDVGLDVVKGK